MALLLVILFISGYILIALEHQTRINKSAIALLLGTLLWTLIPHTDNEIINHLGDTAEILFYLLGAMTIVEWIDTHNKGQTNLDLTGATLIPDYEAVTAEL